MKLSLQIPLHFKFVAALPREISLKPATPLTSYAINVDEAWHVPPPNKSDLNPVDYAVWDAFQQMVGYLYVSS